MNTALGHREQGAATLIISVFLLVTITLIILFAASYNLMQQKVTSNSYQNDQAYEAAEAGLEFGIVYLEQNSALILANVSNGYLKPYTSASTQNVALSNGATFNISYSNPTQNNYNLILVSSSGASVDGSATRVISQLVYYGSYLNTSPTLPAINQSAVTLSSSSKVNNASGSSTIDSASTVAIYNLSETTVNGLPSSYSGHIGADITQNDSNLSSMSTNSLFANYIGNSPTAMQNNAAHVYTNSSTTSYNFLNGMTGTSIWINQTGGQANVSGTTAIGTAANPVIMFVNGNLNISGTAVINGFLYVIGGVSSTSTSDAQINGALVSTGSISFSGSTQLTYSSSILSALRSQTGTTYFARVPGTWRDF